MTATPGVRVVIGPLPVTCAALVTVQDERSVIAINATLRPTMRGRVLLVALNALATPKPAGVPWAGVVAMRANWGA